jgi:micrococcal nuclease
MGLLRIFFWFLRDHERRSTPLSNEPPATVPAIAMRRQVVVISRETVIRGKAYVIDGDTIDIGGNRIRLFGIDAPELDHPFGQNAKWALANLCKGQTIRAVFEGELSHERHVAQCFLADGRDLSAEMVKVGMAVDWPKFSGGRYSHLETPGIRKKLWRCDARQKGRMPPRLQD